MSENILNDISKVYLEQIAVNEAVRGADNELRRAASKERQAEKAADKEFRSSKAGAKKVGPKLSTTPNSKSDTKNYVDKASGEIKYMDRKTKGKHIAGYAFPDPGMANEALDPVGKEDSDIDNDGDTDKSDKYLHKRRKAIGKAIATRKESFSNWRQDLVEVMDEVEKDKKIKEKKVENKITINPKLNEALGKIGGTLLEMVEIDEFDFIVESAYNELLEEGYEEDDIEEALEFALTEAKVTFGHDTPTTEKKRESLLGAARKKLSGIKKAAKQAVATGARKVAKGALGVARKMEGGDKKPAVTAARKPSTYRGAGVGTKEKVSSGSYTPPSKKKAEKPSDPWEGSATTPPKAKTKKTAAPKAKAPATTAKKKKKSKLDDLLASVRSESYVDEKLNLKKAEMGDVIRDFYKSKAPQFKGRSKEKRREMATAAKLTAERGGRRLGEQMDTATPDPSLDKKQQMLDKTKLANLKKLQQKKQQLDRQKLQMQKSGKLPLEAD